MAAHYEKDEEQSEPLMLPIYGTRADAPRSRSPSRRMRRSRYVPTARTLGRCLVPLLYICLGIGLTSIWHADQTGVVIGNLKNGVFSTVPPPVPEVEPPVLPDSLDQVVVRKRGARVGYVSLKFGSGSRHGDTPPPATDGDAAAANITVPYNRYDLSIDLMQNYARRWGYPFWLVREEVLRGPQGAGGVHSVGETGMWSKPAIILSLVTDELRKPKADRLEWILYSDADFVVTNPNVPLETFLPPDTDFGRTQSLLMARDQWGPINAGVLMFRVSQESIKILATVLAAPVYDPNRTWWNGEQTALGMAGSSDELTDNIAIVPPHWFNPDLFGTFQPQHQFKKKVWFPGDFACHLMSAHKTGWEALLDAVYPPNNISRAVAGAVRHPAPEIAGARLDVPLNETRYMTGNDTVAQWWSSWAAMNATERRAYVAESSRQQ